MERLVELLWQPQEGQETSKATEIILRHALLRYTVRTSCVHLVLPLVVAAPASGSRVLVQLQIGYRRNGKDLLRVFTAERNVTDDR